jgi:hypothetical protein
MLGRRLFLTSSEEEYLRLRSITIVDFRIGCQEGAIALAGVCHFRDFFGIVRSDDLTQPTIDAVDPFRQQGLWSVRGLCGVGTCTNHCEGFQGRANRNVTGTRSLTRRITIVVDMPKQKTRQFSTQRLNRSPKARLSELTPWAKKHEERESSSFTDECPEQRGWDLIYAHRFMIPNFPCRHTALKRGPTIDWNRTGLQFDLGDVESRHEIVVDAYTGPAWPFAKTKGSKGLMPFHEADDTHVLRSDPQEFIDRLLRELRIVFPHAGLKSNVELGIEFGRFLQSRSEYDLELRAHFQLQTFRLYSQSH